MKILLAIDYYQPQLGYSEGFIVKGLRDLGHEVTVLTSNYYFPFPNYDETSGKILGPRKLEPGTKVENDIAIIREKLKFEIFARAIIGNHEKHIKEINPDIIIANKVMGYNTIRLAWLKRRYRYKLICYDSHLLSELYRENILLKNIIYGIFKRLLSGLLNKQVDKFIAVQAGTKDVMKKYYGIKKHIDVIPLGTDIKKFHFDKKSRESIRKQFKISEGDFVIIYTGKIIESKGVEILFQSFNYLCQTYSNVKVLLVGDGPEEYFEKCFSLLDKKYHNKIIKAGFQKVNDLYKFYSASDLAVWPLQESTSMNDAAACSIPFIANNTIGDKVRISNDNAFLYKKGDRKSLAEKIELLYNDKKLRIEMGRNGRILAEKKLSWGKITTKYIELSKNA